MLILLPAAFAACPTPTTHLDLARSIAAAEAAMASMDDAQLAGAQTQATEALICLDEPLTDPGLVAAYHRFEAYDAFLHDRFDDTRAAFRAARAAQPEYILPLTLAPTGHPLRTLYDEARPGDGRQPLYVPPWASLLVDGAQSTSRPADRPAIIQLIGSNGQVIATGWVPASYLYPLGLSPAPAPTPLVDTRAPERNPVAVTLLSGGAAVTIVGGALYAIALASKADYLDPTGDLSEYDLANLRRQTNALAGTSVAVLTLGASLGVSGTILW